eukprot:g12611.t1
MPRITPARPTQETSTTVAIRLRPLNDREKEGGQSRIWRCVPTHNSVTQTSPDGNPLPDGKGTFFTYDRIFDEDSSTEAVYDGTAKEIVHSVSRGMNGTIFAYGQTSSGKTFTMQGGGSESTPGIVQIATQDLFRLIQEKTDRMFLMRVSFLEIYQEEIRDLLNPENTNMQVREDPRKGVYIDAHEETVGDYETVLKILKMGEKHRHVGCTEMNSRSSRSHTIFRLVVESQQMYDEKVHASQEEVDQSTLVATLNLVDLAGSESVRHTGATGIRQKEGGMINQSLLTLSRVIQTLTQPGNSHVNYRDSKLTRILQPSLSGNARMAIICCATAAEGFLEETRSTFQFASRAKEIKTRAVVNEIVDDKTQIRRMSQELAALKRQHAEQQAAAAAAGNGGGGNNGGLVETLRQEKAEQAEKIDRLKKLLLNIAPVAAAHDEEGEPVLDFHLDISPRIRRGKRSRETWCPGDSATVVTAPRPLRLLNSNFDALGAIDEDASEHQPKRRSSEAAESRAPGSIAVSNGRLSKGGSGAAATEGESDVVADGSAGDVEAIASKLEEALVAKQETDEEMKEFVAYTEDVERVLASTKALLAQEVEAAREAAGAVATAKADADAAALREQEAIAALQERIAALEADKADLAEQEAVLRAENEEAAAIIAENQARVPSLADADAQTDPVDLAEGTGGPESDAGDRSVADLQAEVVERDSILAELKVRVAELESTLAETREQQQEQEILGKEEKQKADKSLIEALAAQRRAEDAFSAACQSELEMRCRLESAVQQAQDAEKARDEIAATAEQQAQQHAASSGKQQEEIEALGLRLQAVENEAASASTTTEEAKTAAVEEADAARRKLLAHEAASSAKDRTIQELTAIVDSLKADGEKEAREADGLGGHISSEQREEQLVADKQCAEDEAVAARAENAALTAKIEELSQQLKLGDAEVSCAREELEAAKGAASEAEAKLAADMARVVEEAAAASEQLALAKAELETKAGDAVELKGKIESLQSELKSVEETAAKRETANAARAADAESQLQEVNSRLSAATAANEGAAASDELLAEVEGELTAANELVASLQAAAAEHKASSSARVAELEDQLASANESLATAQAADEGKLAAVSESEELLRSRVAELEGELASANESLATAQAADEDKLAALSEGEGLLRSRVSELEDQLASAKESLATAQAASEDKLAAVSESEELLRSRVAELEGELASANESLATAQAADEDKLAAVSEGEGLLRSRVSELEGELEAVTESLGKQLEAAKEAADSELKATTDELRDLLATAQEAAAEARKTLGEKVSLADGLSADVGALREEMSVATIELDALREAAATSNTEHEAEVGAVRAELEQVKMSLMVKEEEVTRVEQQAVDEAREAQGAASAAAEALAEKEAAIASMKKSMEAVEGIEGELTQALEDSESLSKEVLDLTDQLVKKDADLSQLREQVETLTAELAEVRTAAAAAASPAATSNSSTDGFDGEAAEASSELRRLRVELDKKGSELDTAMKDHDAVRAELKVVKDMLGAATSAAGAAGADEESLRKRVSQLVCENGLLKGEKDRQEALAAEARAEANSNSSRSAAEVERLEREVERLSGIAGRASEATEDGDRARAALSAMEARLSEARQERAELQEASQRSLDRCSEAEREVETLSKRLAELEGRDSGRDAVVALETKVDELEQELRRAAASKASMESDAREHANRAKRLQGEVEMMRSEYEVVSEEASGLRGSLAGAEAKLEEALAAQSASSENRSAELEAEIARLRERMSELDDSHVLALQQEEARRSEMHKTHEEAVAALEEKVTESLELAEQIEADQDGNLDALRAKLAREHGEELDALKAQMEEVVRAAEVKEKEALELSEECDTLSADLKRLSAAAGGLEERLGTAEEARVAVEEALSETVAAEKLIAENKAGDMEAELDRLRKEVAEAQQTAAKDQGMLIRAAEESMAVLDKAAKEKDVAIAELQASLDAALLTTSTEETAAEVEKATEALNAKIAALTATTAEYEETIKKQDARIKKLEQVRLTNGQVEKLQAMKASAKKTAAENIELKQRLAVLKERLEATTADAATDGSGAADAGSTSAVLAAANERNAELQGAKETLIEKMKQYGKRVYELEKEHARVHAAVEELGGSVPDGGDLGDAVLECAERLLGGRGGCDGSMMSTGSHDEAVAAAAAARAVEEVQQELQEVREALRKEEASKAVLKEQMIAGVAKFRALEAQEKTARERLEQVEVEQRGAVSAAVKMKEKDHERKLKFLQEENVQLFNEITTSKAKMAEYTAEIKTLKEKLAALQTSHQAPPSATKKRALGDRTNNTSTSSDANPIASKNKPGAAIGTPGVKPAAAAERRAASRALIDGEGPAAEDGPGECNQS